MQNKLASYLGLAKKAGAVICGTDLIIDGMRRGKVMLVVAASDISAGTRKKLSDKCSFYDKPLLDSGLDMDALSKAVGLDRLTAAAGVTDAGFVKMITGAAGDGNKQ